MFKQIHSQPGPDFETMMSERRLFGPAGAFEQNPTVLNKSLSGNQLSGDRRESKNKQMINQWVAVERDSVKMRN